MRSRFLWLATGLVAVAAIFGLGSWVVRLYVSEVPPQGVLLVLYAATGVFGAILIFMMPDSNRHLRRLYPVFIAGIFGLSVAMAQVPWSVVGSSLLRLGSVQVTGFGRTLEQTFAIFQAAGSASVLLVALVTAVWPGKAR